MPERSHQPLRKAGLGRCFVLPVVFPGIFSKEFRNIEKLIFGILYNGEVFKLTVTFLNYSSAQLSLISSKKCNAGNVQAVDYENKQYLDKDMQILNFLSIT